MKKPKIELPENLAGLPQKLPKLTILGEFKKFALRGNVLDLAVGVIIGGAFQKIVSSAVNDMLMPLVGLFTGSVNFNNQFLILKLPQGVTKDMVTSFEVAQNLGATTFNYGSFITAVIDFLIMAFGVFLLVKLINRLTDIYEGPGDEPGTTKVCPYCCSEIPIKARRCPHCTSELSDGEKGTSPEAHKG